MGQGSVQGKVQGEGSAAEERVPERLALFVSVHARDRAAPLLQGLSEPWRSRALTALETFVRLGPADRRALVAWEFGPHPDGERRLQRVMDAASPELRVALYRALPGHLRSLFPELAAEGPPPPPDRPPVARYARRRLAETTR
jgi:hypothetical protein